MRTFLFLCVIMFQHKNSRSTCLQMLYEIVSWKRGKFHWKTPVLELLLNKVAALRPANFLKIDSNTGAFLWIFRNLFKDTFLSENLQTTASEIHRVSFLRVFFLILQTDLFWQTPFPEFYNYLFERAKILICFCLRWIFRLLHFLKQPGFCSVVHLLQAFRKQTYMIESVFNKSVFTTLLNTSFTCRKNILRFSSDFTWNFFR